MGKIHHFVVGAQFVVVSIYTSKESRSPTTKTVSKNGEMKVKNSLKKQPHFKKKPAFWQVL